MKKLFLVMMLVVMQPAFSDDTDPLVIGPAMAKDLSLLDALLSVPVLTTAKPVTPLGFKEISIENLPKCPVQPYFYNCIAMSPSSLGVGYSSSKFEAGFQALANCDKDTPDNQSCKIVECN